MAQKTTTQLLASCSWMWIPSVSEKPAKMINSDKATYDALKLHNHSEDLEQECLGQQLLNTQWACYKDVQCPQKCVSLLTLFYYFGCEASELKPSFVNFLTDLTNKALIYVPTVIQ